MDGWSAIGRRRSVPRRDAIAAAIFPFDQTLAWQAVSHLPAILLALSKVCHPLNVIMWLGGGSQISGLSRRGPLPLLVS
jgi:hypothetical protein